MRRINNRTELIELARELGTRTDWHEPDEQELTAEVKGSSFDNAGFWPHDERRAYTAPEIIEQHVILSQEGVPVAAVNLATLFAWATGYEGDTLGHPDPQDPKEIARKTRAFGERVALASREGQNDIVGAIVSDIVTRVVEELARQMETGKL